MVRESEIQKAVEILRAGGLVALPTETVYGLGADATNREAVAKVFAVKGRPPAHPLIVHIGGAEWLDEWAREIPDAARRLAAKFWPGPLTLILKRSDRVIDHVTGGQDTVGLRVPDQADTLRIIRELGHPIAAPSANRFGRVSPTSADHVREDLGDEIDFIVDGGPCRVGIESTIVDMSCEKPEILRLGAITEAEVAEVVGRPVPVREKPASVRAPGTLESHYAPEASVLLAEPSEMARIAGEFIRQNKRVVMITRPVPGCGAPSEDENVPIVLPVPPSDEAFARNLYALLREADRREADVILVSPPVAEAGLGRAVADRLRRAAAPRSGIEQ